MGWILIFFLFLSSTVKYRSASEVMCQAQQKMAVTKLARGDQIQVLQSWRGHVIVPIIFPTAFLTTSGTSEIFCFFFVFSFSRYLFSLWYFTVQ